MKLSITLIVLGILGIFQYVYFQFTSLALNYTYKIWPDEEFGKFGLQHIETTVTRDWSLGLAGILIGAVLLVLGIWRLKRIRQNSKAQLGESKQ